MSSKKNVVVAPRDEWRLSPSEKRLFALLQERDWIARELATAAGLAERNSVRVMLHRLRIKLAEFGVDIPKGSPGWPGGGLAQLRLAA